MFRSGAPFAKHHYYHEQDGKNTHSTIKLTEDELSSIETTKLLSISEKVELLLVSLGNKLTTEIYKDDSYFFDKVNQLEQMNEATLNKLQSFFHKLPFPFFIDRLVKINRASGKQREFTWLQVCLNQATATFMESNKERITPFEQGILYGYPISAIRAFTGLIEAEKPSRQPTVAEYFMAGIGSATFSEEEKQYYETWWKKLTELSPKIVSEAEKHHKMVYFPQTA